MLLMHNYDNPILRGMNPDPSICRVGEDYYLVTSTFEFYPGIPLYHSKNLINWEMIGHCLSSPKQLSIKSCSHSLGIYAATVRWHGGLFIMTTTDSDGIRNFIMHTNAPEKGWSDPVRVEQGGIDPSLFFDADGSVYYTSTGYDENGKDIIQMCQIDPVSGQRLSPSRAISHGCGGCYPEGPHIYKKGDYYYLVLAEGGTQYGHRATVQRSRCVWGPYESSPYGPFLSHIDQMGRNPIQAVGHADLLEDANGNWWTVCLGIRTLSYGLLHNLGRETFLAPVVWTEDGWPVAGENGRLNLTMEGPLPGQPSPRRSVFSDDFTGRRLKPEWTFVRDPRPGLWSLSERIGCLTLAGNVSLSDPRQSPAFCGVRQREHAQVVTTELKGELEEGQRAGLAAYYNANYHYEIYLRRKNACYFVGMTRRTHDWEEEVFFRQIEYLGELQLKISADERFYHFYYASEDGAWEEAGQAAVAGLCTEGTAGNTYTGVFLGLFTVGGQARFSGFEMQDM